MTNEYDIIIIGGGYYGVFAAYTLAQKYADMSILVIEAEEQLFTRASSTNQGQLHMGYVYSADADLARDCVREEPIFRNNFSSAVVEDTQSYYAVHDDSEISAKDYEAFCKEQGLPLKRVEPYPSELFSQVQAVYKTPEKTFNSAVLQELMLKKLKKCVNITVSLGEFVKTVEKQEYGVLVRSSKNAYSAPTAINVAFAGINDIHDRSGLARMSMRYDSFLHFLVDLPEAYRDTSMSVVRGQYCFVVPSRFRGGHLFASARHRRVATSIKGSIPQTISEEEVAIRYKESIEECQQYIPILSEAVYKGYTFGVRVAYYEGQDDTYTSKVILKKDYDGLNGYHVLLGGKVSALFDAEQMVLGAVRLR